MKIYIAGRISGEEGTYKEKFKKVEQMLKDKGHAVMNPAILPCDDRFTHSDYLHICLAMIDSCEAVYMMPDWIVSDGAKKEYEYARLSDKQILFEDDFN